MPPADPVAEQLDADNVRDPECFVARYAPAVVVETAAGQRMVEGHDGMRALYGPLFVNSPALHAEVATRIRAGEFVVDVERVRGPNLPGLPPAMHAARVDRVRDVASCTSARSFDASALPTQALPHIAVESRLNRG